MKPYFLGSTVIVFDEESFKDALSVARGKYQKGIILGLNSPTGKDLAGNDRTRKHLRRYAESRNNLFVRFNKKQITHSLVGGLQPGSILILGKEFTDFNRDFAKDLIYFENFSYNEAVITALFSYRFD